MASSSSSSRILTAAVAPSARRIAAPSRAFATSRPTAAAAPPSQPASQPQPSSSAVLPWSSYFALRKSRARYGLFTLYPTTLLSLSTAGGFFLTSEINPLQPVFGVDPAILAVGATLASGFAGYLVGPLLGSGLWSLSHRGQLKAMEKRDADFYEHVRRNRVDPSRQNMQNPVPDYYGEKIQSISDYRRWLRDCSVYRRKAAHGLKQDAEALAAAEQQESRRL